MTVPDSPINVITEVFTVQPNTTYTPTPRPITPAPKENQAPAPLPTATQENITAPNTVGDPYAPELGNSGYDVQRYTLTLALDPDLNSLYEVTANVLIEATATRPLNEIWLDFIGFNVSVIFLDDAAVDFERLGDKLVIFPATSLQTGDAFLLSITYAGRPEIRQSPYAPFEDHLGLFYSGGENLYALSEPDGARFWFPCNDHPRDKAKFRFVIIVPQGFTAVANGQLLDTQPLTDAKVRYIWEHNYPMATYLATVAVGRYHRMDDVSPNGIPIRHYVFSNFHPNFEVQMGIVGEALDWMSEKFGPYPFEAFGYVSITDHGLSLETQTMVLLDTRMIDQDTIVHEMAHMWFGDWVSLDSWGEMWRNEGFATYFQWYYPYRDKPEEFERFMDRQTQAVLDQPNLEALNSLTPMNLFGYEAYIKGAVAVHALRQQMGDEAFFAGLRQYFELYGGSVASDEEFKAVMEEAAGISLDGFFAEWIEE